jgi:hypothetical protein
LGFKGRWDDRDPREEGEPKQEAKIFEGLRKRTTTIYFVGVR